MKKLKLISLLATFALCLCTLAVGVWAARQATFESTGTITFTAKNVYARVTGQITGAGTITPNSGSAVSGTKTLPTILYNAENKDGLVENVGELGSWENNALAFDENGTDMYIEVTVTNLADRPLWVEVVNNVDPVANLIKIVEGGSVHEVSANQSKTIKIKFSIQSLDNSVASANYNFSITLLDVSEIPTADDADMYFEFETIDSTTAKVSGSKSYTSDTITIPSLIQIANQGVYGVYKVTTIKGYPYGTGTWGDTTWGTFCNLNVDEIIIPQSIITLEENCFYGAKVKKIKIPGSVVNINGIVKGIPVNYELQLDELWFESETGEYNGSVSHNGVVLVKKLVIGCRVPGRVNETSSDNLTCSNIQVQDEVVFKEGIEDLSGFGFSASESDNSCIVRVPSTAKKIDGYFNDGAYSVGIVFILSQELCMSDDLFGNSTNYFGLLSRATKLYVKAGFAINSEITSEIKKLGSNYAGGFVKSENTETVDGVVYDVYTRTIPA